MRRLSSFKESFISLTIKPVASLSHAYTHTAHIVCQSLGRTRTKNSSSRHVQAIETNCKRVSPRGIPGDSPATVLSANRLTPRPGGSLHAHVATAITGASQLVPIFDEHSFSPMHVVSIAIAGGGRSSVVRRSELKPEDPWFDPIAGQGKKNTFSVPPSQLLRRLVCA